MPNHIDADQFGDIVMRRINGSDVHVIEAPPFARISLSTLIAADPRLVRLDDHDIVLCGTVAYRPLEFDASLLVLICQLVRDDRPWRRHPDGGSPQ